MSDTQPTGAVTTLTSGTFADAIFAPNGAQLYTISGNTVSVIDLATRATVASYTVGTTLGGLTVSADGLTLAAVEEAPGTGLGTLYTIDLSNGSVATVHPAGTTTLYDAAFLADGTVVVSQQLAAPLQRLRRREH